MTVKNTLDQIIDWRMSKRQYSQSYLAQRMGMTQKAYSKIETGETKLTVYHLIQIGEILEVGINELINPEISAVYHGHHTHTGKGIAMTKKPNDDLIELYENQIASKDREIDMLHKYIARLEKGEPQ